MELSCDFVFTSGYMIDLRCNLPVSSNNRCKYHDHVIFKEWYLEDAITFGIGKDVFESIYKWIHAHPTQFDPEFYNHLILSGRRCVSLLLANIEKLDPYPPRVSMNSLTDSPKKHLDVTIYNSNYFRTKCHDYIITPSCLVIGKHDEQLGKCVPLTEQDNFNIEKLGLLTASYVQVIPL